MWSCGYILVTSNITKIENYEFIKTVINYYNFPNID